MDRSDLLIAAARQMGLSLSRNDFAVRCDSQSALWEMCRVGLGIGFAQKTLVLQTPGMVAIDLPLPIPPLEVWLTSHKELHSARRIRVVYDRLAVMLGDWLKT